MGVVTKLSPINLRGCAMRCRITRAGKVAIVLKNRSMLNDRLTLQAQAVITAIVAWTFIVAAGVPTSSLPLTCCF